MKLLSPNQIKESFNNKQAVDVVQAGYMKKIVADLQKSINTETDKFNENMANQRKVYGEEKMALQGEIKALEGILEGKREERKALMIPVDTLKQQAEELVKELQSRKAELVKQEEDLEEKIELVKIKLDQASTKEQFIASEQAHLDTRRMGIDEESEQVSKSHEKLNQMMSDFNKKVTEKSKELAEKETILNIAKQRDQEYIEKREKEFADQTKGLADKRNALERAWAELERLKLKK